MTKNPGQKGTVTCRGRDAPKWGVSNEYDRISKEIAPYSASAPPPPTYEQTITLVPHLPTKFILGFDGRAPTRLFTLTQRASIGELINHIL